MTTILAEKVISCRTGRRAADPSHLGHELFQSLPSSKRLGSIRTRTTCHKISFFATPVSLMCLCPRDQLKFISNEFIKECTIVCTFILKFEYLRNLILYKCFIRSNKNKLCVKSKVKKLNSKG